MNIKQRYFALLITVFISLTQAATSHEITEDVFEKIILNEAHCVIGYDNDKVYLSPENIHPTEGGLFLDIGNNEYVHLIRLQSDSKGCWIPKVCKDISIYKPCPSCGQPYLIRCNNPECPSNKK